MAATVVGRAKSGAGKAYEVKWDPASRDIYVSYAGWSLVGQATSASDAMHKAQGWLYDK